MRAGQKKQAEEFIKLLGQAHDEIKKEIEKKEFFLVMDLLIQCQQGVIQLGNLIEKEEGEKFVTIGLLENYCEIVCQIYKRMEQGQFGNVDKLYGRLCKQFVQIERSVKEDILVKREVVFLPYKASMWDSLESVWKAAKEELDCNVYVIPIPYYDKNPDGSFREFHYEGHQYPSYVPITHYKSYSFEERCPDIIFIHNPYDDWNKVTSVHPFFFSENLKRFTRQLIYIPYFVLKEIKLEQQNDIENIKYFCAVPGVIHADKVIVQSETMRQVYIAVLEKMLGENNRKVWENKIIGLGSPKFDKVLSEQKQILQISEDWINIIRKPDGTWKKIILYNISIAALLEYEDQMLEKIKDVFRIFWENKDNIALWWRPHPLITATIKSMKPNLWTEYQRLVEQYKQEKWGIYDDTADVDRALVISHAYYGDKSSLVQIYQELGKPILIQNVKIHR